MDRVFQKQQKLLEIAAEDEVYCVWKNSKKTFAATFQDFLDSQPEDIRNMLLGYTESERMMGQRLINLACENMEFPDQQ